jgi:hypothetical protein
MVIQVSWGKSVQYSIDVARRIKESGYEIDWIIGIGRGGFIPAALISGYLDIKNTTTISAHSYEGRKRSALKIISAPDVDLSGKNILLIDDIVSSGETLKGIKNLLFERYKVKNVKSAVLVVSSVACKEYPEFYGEAITRRPDEWIIMPWDNKEDFN